LPKQTLCIIVYGIQKYEAFRLIKGRICTFIATESRMEESFTPKRGKLSKSVDDTEQELEKSNKGNMALI